MRHELGFAGQLTICAFMLVACNQTQKVAPQEAGKRGENCQARNDCEEGLACISGVCSRNDFDIEAGAMQCDIIDCEETADCCGDRPTEAPAKCLDAVVTCEVPNVPGCVNGDCSGDSDCGGGVCGSGRCDNSFGVCTDDNDCGDICNGGFCFNSNQSCSDEADCQGSCQFRTCDCGNPLYDPSDPICGDPDCQNVCLLRCDSERCVVDDSCKSDLDCTTLAPMCDDGRCIECAEDDDCDMDEGEKCQDGSCQKPCTQNENCALFSACEDGECVEKGCSSDRECILAISDSSGEDSRLVKCLPSDEEGGVPVCKLPCENDGSCAEFETCQDGFCKFIGCDTDEECRSFFGLAEREMEPSMPFVSKAICR